MSRLSEIDQFVERQLGLLELERRAEVEEAQRLHLELGDAELERRGLRLLKLRVLDESIGLGGRSLLVLGRTAGGELPAHRFGPGDIVGIGSGRAPAPRSAADGVATAVVFRVRRETLTLALDETELDLPEPLRIDRMANDVTYRRMREALERLRRGGGPAARVREVVFGRREAALDTSALARGPREALEPTLDPSQREAVAFALASQDLALIHGPPGTGKTTAAIQVIRQTVRRGDRVLACAPSNVAADNMVERLARAGIRVVRIGHPARLLPSVLEHSLDSLVEEAEGTRVAQDLRREIERRARTIRKAADWRERRQRREELRGLRRELAEIEQRTVREIAGGAEVIVATNTGAAEPVITAQEFDLAVIDEAAQALEASSWIPLLLARKAVLAGDHLQLPPTILSQKAARDGLARTLFERLAEEQGDRVARMLTVQYRMHERIMGWSSDALYGGRLEADASVRSHLLAQIEGVASTGETLAPMLLIDTAGRGFEETEDAESDSRANAGEAELVVIHARRLLEAGVRPQDIGVITPYNAQVDLLRRELGTEHPDLEIGSVDGFQGREKEAIIISLVRSNPRGDVGFLADRRRLNVAVTRARRHVAVVGDSATVSNHPFLAGLVEYLERHGEYRSAWEYMP